MIEKNNDMLEITGIADNERFQYYTWFGQQKEVIITRIMSKYINRYYTLRNSTSCYKDEVLSSAALIQVIQIYYIADLHITPKNLSNYWFGEYYLETVQKVLKELRSLN